MNFTKSEQKALWDKIDALTQDKNLDNFRQARQLLRDWLAQHPEDVASRDAGGELAMLEDALELILAEQNSEPLAA